MRMCACEGKIVVAISRVFIAQAGKFLEDTVSYSSVPR